MARLALRDESEELPGFLLSIEGTWCAAVEEFRVQLPAVSIAMLGIIEKAAECAQRDHANVRVLAYSDFRLSRVLAPGGQMYWNAKFARCSRTATAVAVMAALYD